MTRRFITSIVAAIALASSAVLAFSGPAQAHMGVARTGYHYGWHYGWHATTAAYRGDSCYQKQWVWTSAGWRWQWANTCNAGFGAGTGLFGGLLGF